MIIRELLNLKKFFFQKDSGNDFGFIDADTLEAASSHRSFNSMSGILSWLLTLTKNEFPDFSLSEKVGLEIGTGKFLNHAIGLHLCGCKQVITIDKYRQYNSEAVNISMKKSILARRFLSPHITHDQYISRFKKLQKTEYKLNKLDSCGIKYFAPFDLKDLHSLNIMFDLVFSYTVLEHVPPNEIFNFLEFSCDAINRDGICIHFIDLEDHQNPFNDPFRFLSSGFEWTERDSFNRGNRIRFSTWVNILGSIKGMEWRYPYIVVRNDVELPRNIDNSFSMFEESDLRISAFVVVGKKVN